MSRAKRRYYRTVLLGVAAMATLIWAAVDQFGIPWEEMLRLFLLVLAGVALIILLAGLAAGAWIAIRALFKGTRE